MYCLYIYTKEKAFQMYISQWEEGLYRWKQSILFKTCLLNYISLCAKYFLTFHCHKLLFFKFVKSFKGHIINSKVKVEINDAYSYQ